MTGTIVPVTMATVFLFAVFSVSASATTYYVSSSTGNDGNNGTSSSTAWQTITHVNAQSFNPGDSILFKRGDVWNQSLTPPSSGTSGNPITFDAYGSGPAPNFTGYYDVPSSAWVLVTGNAWKAPLPAGYTSINFCLFGSIWGQKVSAVTSNLTEQWDFYLANGYIYVYSVGSPALYYNEPIVPMALSNTPVIDINGQSWLVFQHFLINWFDEYGVYVQGTSDHLVFANMESDSMIPQGTQPLGFYVNENAPGPGDIKIYNSEAHLNYDGFRFDGAATAISMINDKAYANRDGALVDNTGAVTYSHCHFYASSLAVAGSTDVEWTSGSGPTAGARNIAADTPPAVQVWKRYPAMVTMTVDDAGMTPGTDTYYADTVLPVADAAGVPVGAAITVGYPLAQTLISEFQGWINAGCDVTAHSISHTYYVNTDALDIQYVGSGTAATLNISGNTLTITVTGAPSDGVSYNLTRGQPQGTMLALAQALAATGKYTYSFQTPCQGPYGTGCAAYTAAALLSQDLADVSGQDVKSAVYHMQLNVTSLTTDEITLSRQWMTTNLTGLPAIPVYVYPGGYETTAMQGITEGVPYTGARGALKEDLGVKDTYADGFNVQNITSFGVNPSWMGITPASLNQKIQALVWKESVWGVPWGIFWHLNELTQDDPVGGTEITDLIEDFQASGATVKTNTGLVNWLLGGTQATGTDGNYYYKIPATSMTLDFRPTESSPVVDAGENLGAAYALDINGVNQNDYGTAWEIGAHVYQGYAVYGGGTGSGAFTIGTGQTAAVTLPQTWVNNNEGNAAFSYELSLPGTWVAGPAPGCTFHAPYWSGTPTQTGLQSAINDIEACRTATGAGIALDIPPALYTTSSASGTVIPQSNTSYSNSFLILRSTMDANLPNGQTVCSHGVQDNLATSTDIGLDNRDCAGDAMYYQLGTTITNVSAGAFMLANSLAENTANYDDLQYMWQTQCSGTNCTAIQTCSPLGTSSTSNPPKCASTTIAPDHWLIMDGAFSMSTGNTGDQDVAGSAAAGTETSASQFATHIHWRKDWVHGDWTSLTAGDNSVSAGFGMACVYCSIVDSQVSEVLRPGAEGHVVLLLGSQYKIDHNWFEGQSSSIFSGGYSDGSGPSISGYVPNQDTEIRRNRLTFPYAWLGVNTIPSGNAHWSGASLARKNCLENKEGERVLIAGNICENTDNSGGQAGMLLKLTATNNSTSTPGTNYQSTLNDYTVANNIFRNSCEGTLIESSSSSGSGSGVAFAPNRIGFTNNLSYDVTIANPGCSTVHSQGEEWDSIRQSWLGTVTENAAGTAATFVATCSVDESGNCPSGPPGAGFQVTDIRPGDPVSVTGCTSVSASNMPTQTLSGHVLPSKVGGYAAASNNPASLSVSYSWTAAANAVDNSGTCLLTNTEGAPQNLIYSHNTLITDSTWTITSANNLANGTTHGPNFQTGTLLQNSILLGGGIDDPTLGEGTATETFDYDISADTIDYLVMPTRTASTYTEYANNAAFSRGPCTNSAGCSPPLSIYFPSQSYCTGSTPTSACVGFKGAMSASSMPLALSDYHGYELTTGSVFKAGGSAQASDGSDMGANVPAADTAQTLNQYICASACGEGPYPDH